VWWKAPEQLSEAEYDIVRRKPEYVAGLWFTRASLPLGFLMSRLDWDTQAWAPLVVVAWVVLAVTALSLLGRAGFFVSVLGGLRRGSDIFQLAADVIWYRRP
jgi:hypothetical protein